MTKYVISDFGETPKDLRNVDTGEILHIPRYGVWQINGPRQKSEVIDTSDDLESLRTKYPGAGFFTIVAYDQSTITTPNDVTTDLAVKATPNYIEQNGVRIEWFEVENLFPDEDEDIREDPVTGDVLQFIIQKWNEETKEWDEYDDEDGRCITTFPSSASDEDKIAALRMLMEKF